MIKTAAIVKENLHSGLRIQRNDYVIITYKLLRYCYDVMLR